MSEDEDYSRRQLLQAIGVTGSLGALGGAATGAYLSDRERFSDSLIGTGELALELATDRADDTEGLRSFSGDDFRADESVEVGFPGIEPGDTGVLRIGQRLGDDQGQIWMRAASSTETELGAHIDVELLRRPTCVVDESVPQFRGTLEDLIGAYADGDLLTEGCVRGRRCLDLKWSFRDDVPAELSETSLSCSFEFTAVQCRHNRTYDNPWNETN